MQRLIKRLGVRCEEAFVTVGTLLRKLRDTSRRNHQKDTKPTNPSLSPEKMSKRDLKLTEPCLFSDEIPKTDTKPTSPCLSSEEPPKTETKPTDPFISSENPPKGYLVPYHLETPGALPQEYQDKIYERVQRHVKSMGFCEDGKDMGM